MNIPPLNIGSLSFTSPLIQAPLAGISCSAMRRLSWEFGGLAYACTEMLSAHQLANDLDRSPRYQHIAQDEGPVCFQLGGHDPDILARATHKAQACGANIIDLNMGCPMPKIRAKGSGSALISHPQKLKTILKKMKAETSCPLTVKIRVDGNSGDAFNQPLLDALLEEQPDALIVHGRHWTTDYTSPLFYEDMRFFVEHCPFPVIVNGDVDSGKSCSDLLKKTGAKAAMVARAAIGKPWIFKKIITELQGKTFISPTLNEQSDLFLKHVQYLIKLEQNEFLACIQARRLFKHYFLEYDIDAKTLIAALQTTTFDGYQQLFS